MPRTGRVSAAFREWPGRSPAALPMEGAVSRSAAACGLAGRSLPVLPGFLLPAAEAAAISGAALRRSLGAVEKAAGRRLGDARNPLVLAVSGDESLGAAAWYPWVGLTRRTLPGLVRRLGRPRLANRMLAAAIEFHGVRVHGLSDERRTERRPAWTTLEDWECLVEERLASHDEQCGAPFPDDALEQLVQVVRAAARAGEGAVAVQAVAFGGGGPDCCEVTCYSRDPRTGAGLLLAARAQQGDATAQRDEELAALCADWRDALEESVGGIAEASVVVEDGMPWIESVRPAAAAPRERLKAAYELVRSGRLTRRRALESLADVDPVQLGSNRVPAAFTPAWSVLGTAMAPGAAVGALALDAEEAMALRRSGRSVISAARPGSVEEWRGVAVASGVILLDGGLAAPAAALARRRAIPCVAVSGRRGTRGLILSGVEVRSRQELTVDGTEGRILAGAAPLEPEAAPEELPRLRGWIADEGLAEHPLRR